MVAVVVVVVTFSLLRFIFVSLSSTRAWHPPQSTCQSCLNLDRAQIHAVVPIALIVRDGVSFRRDTGGFGVNKWSVGTSWMVGCTRLEVTGLLFWAHLLPTKESEGTLFSYKGKPLDMCMHVCVNVCIWSTRFFFHTTVTLASGVNRTPPQNRATADNVRMERVQDGLFLPMLLPCYNTIITYISCNRVQFFPCYFV